MLKTIISLGVISSLIFFFLFTFPEVTMFLNLVKGSLIYNFGLFFSYLTIAVIFFEIAFAVSMSILRKL